MQGRQPGETSQSSFRTGSSSCQGCSATVATPRGLSRGAEGVRWQKISSICDTVVSFSLLSALVIASLAVGRNGPKSQGCLSRTSSCCRERCYLAFAHFFMVRCVPGAFAPFSATWSAFSEVVACHGSDDVLRSRRSSEVHRRGAPGGTDASLHIALLHLTWLCCMYPSANVDLHKMGCPKKDRCRRLCRSALPPREIAARRVQRCQVSSRGRAAGEGAKDRGAPKRV